MKDKIYSLLLVTSGDAAPGHMTFQTLFTTRSDNELREIRQYLMERHAGFRRESFARNSRQVVVVSVDSKIHSQHINEPGRNGLRSQPVKRGQLFPSASAASGWLGLKHNEVAMALSHVAQSEAPHAVVRGVTLAYADSIAE